MGESSQPRRADPRPLNDRFAFKPIALLLLIPVILAGAGLAAVVIAPPFVAAALGVKKIDAKLTAAGADFTRIPRFPQRSTIYASDGKTVLATVYLDNRELVRLNQISKPTKTAVLSIEDSGFYHHGALNWSSLVRAIVANARAGTIVEGASTITQQLVKNTLGLNPLDRSFERKFQELALAIRVEQKYTKDQILEMYLNQVYLGNGVYGIGTAAEYYFGEPASKLDLAEGATLAGLIRAPTYYDPIAHPRRARIRRNDVLNRMLGQGILSPALNAKLKALPLGLSNKAGVYRQKKPPYFVTYLERQIVANPDGEFDALGKTAVARRRALYQGGLNITTTFDPTWQNYAQAAANQPYAISLYTPPGQPKPDTAIVSEDVKTGAIRTMLSGRDFAKDQLDLVDSPHAPGSSFKPYVLTAAFEEGISPTATYSSKSPYFPPNGWPGSACNCVMNAEGAGDSGMIDLYTATTDSVNVVFAQLIQDVGPQNVVDVAHRMGVTSDLPAVDSLATGSVGITPIDQASGYQTLANGGVHCVPYTVERISDNHGTVYQHKPDCTQVVSPGIAHLVTTMLQNVVTSGTGVAANLYSWPVAGKTGTADGNTNVWFVGYTAQVVTAVWVGSPGLTYSLGSSAFGGTVSAPIWHAYMMQVMQGMPPEQFPYAPLPSPKLSPVPNVVGLDQTAATAAVTGAGFQVAILTVDAPDKAGTVVGQFPAGGAGATPGSTVTLQVSNGKGTAAVAVPNVLKMSQAAATSALTAAGFGVAVSLKVVTNPAQYGVVLLQSPGGGANAPKGSTVTITVGSRA
jgi:membrane peptidoglycan carboxypeptidase